MCHMLFCMLDFESSQNSIYTLLGAWFLYFRGRWMWKMCFYHVIQFKKSYFCCLSHPRAVKFVFEHKFLRFFVSSMRQPQSKIFISFSNCDVIYEFWAVFFIILGEYNTSNMFFYCCPSARNTKNTFFLKKNSSFFEKTIFRCKDRKYLFTTVHFCPLSFFFFSIFKDFWLSLAHWWHFVRIQTESIAVLFFALIAGHFFIFCRPCAIGFVSKFQNKQIAQSFVSPKFLRIYVKNSHVHQNHMWNYLTIGWHFFDSIVGRPIWLLASKFRKFWW